MANLFIVVEGLSGTGKTTVAKALSEKLKAFYFTTPPPQLSEIRHWIDENADFETRYKFYLAGISLASLQIEKILEEKPVVCDRYIITTLAFHASLGLNVDSIPEDILKPDITFLVECNEKIRNKRLYNRGMSPNDKMEKELDTDKKFLAEYKKFPMIPLDNTGPLEKTVEEAMKIIKSHEKS